MREGVTIKRTLCPVARLLSCKEAFTYLPSAASAGRPQPWHGGLFKTKGVGQSILAAAIDAPVSVMETAGEGGAWGIALLASYMINKGADESLAAFLDSKVFAGQKGEKMEPKASDVQGFNEFMKLYGAGLAIERAAVENI